MSVNGQAVGKRKSILPWFFFTAAFVLLVFWVSGCLFDVQTSEAFFGGPNAHSLMPNWLLVKQPWDFMQGTLDPNMVVPVLVGWGVECFFLLFTFAFEACHMTIGKFNKALAPIFKTAMWGVVIYNGVTDYNFFTGDILKKFIFSAILSGIVMFAGTCAVTLIQMGINEW